jgi:4-hydroxy-3-methylbut-2-en-1-yl diphosphate reductase
MLNLRINIDPNSGFCFGVVFAIEMAEEILEQQGHLFCLGDIVHNDEEVKRLEKKGMKIIGYDELINLHNEKVLIRAHGEPPSTYKIAVENNLELVDASCPVVLKLQNRIKNAHDRKENIFIYGKHGHAEVVGLWGQTQNTATVFQSMDDLDQKSLPSEITLFSQTTKSMDSFYGLTNKLQQSGVKVNANDTICRQVSNRDQELREFVKNYDVVMFVSGMKSSNGKSLFRVCKENNPNTFFISNPGQISKSWFSKKNKVGICGATSTPMWLMEDVKKTLEKL